MEGCVFAPAVSAEEWATVPESVAKKLESFVTEKFDELITAKALQETNRFNAAQELEEVRAKFEAACKENEELKLRFEAQSGTIAELEKQLSTITSEVGKLQSNCNRLEAEAADFRHQRNLAVDERDEQVTMLQRRSAEVERLQSEVTTLTRQLEAAVNAKCEALNQVEEVAAMKLRLEYREKRIDQERQLLNSQVESLTEDLNSKTDELMSMRRDNTYRCIQLETKLSEKTQELVVANEQIKSLNDINNNFAARNEELSQKLLAQRDTDAKMNESYMNEMEAKTKLANAYKSMFDESKQHAEGLKEALTEVQQLLKHATDQYGELETKHKESELTHEEIVTKKNECIALLKKELEVSKELIENCKQEQLHKDMEGLSPTASSASRLLKSGMTVTEIYSKYLELSEKVVDLEKENTQLRNSINSVVHEVEEKGPYIQKLREDYSNTLDANDLLQKANNDLMSEVYQLREANAECVKLEAKVSRENDRLKKEVADLSRQVCHLLQEVEHSRVGSSSTSTDMDLSDSVSSADIITKRLVTFNDIAELQGTNRKLLVLVRELSGRQEEAESFDPAAISEMKAKLESLRDAQSELLEERDRQTKMMVTLGNQRDMYRNLYTQAIRASGEEVPSHLQNNSTFNESGLAEKTRNDTDSQEVEERVTELLGQIDKYKKNVEQLKVENEVYRNEKTANEKILLEQMDKMRSECKELVKLNCKLSSQVENSDEKFKVAQNNIEIYKKQINALEKQNKIYSETIVKHEQAITYLKTETMQSQTKLSTAEVTMGNLQKENALLKDAEMRLVKERENMRRESHSQNLLQSNIELIKATIERADAEGKIRLETRLDESLRECGAVRRRLQEEQDRFRQLTQHMESQLKTAKQRAEEEKVEADKLRKELAETRDELVLKANQIEDLTKKLKTAALVIPESNTDGHKICDLEQQVSDAKAEIDALKAKLKGSKEAADQYCNIASASENQLKIVMEQLNELTKELEKEKEQVLQLKEKCSELEGELSIHMDDQDMANATTHSKSHQLQEELNVKSMDLKTAREELEKTRAEVKSLIENLKAVENKYAREVMLHSADLQMLTDTKAELEKASGALNEVQQARDCAVQALEEHKAGLQAQEAFFKKEKESLEQRFKDTDAQNSLLLDQIEALNTQLSVIQAQATSATDTPLNRSTAGGATPDVSFNVSFTEDEVRSSEQLLSIIKYLRQEKDIAVSKAEIMEAEFDRIKSKSEILKKELEDAKAVADSERNKSEVSVVTAAKHAEVLRRVETLNAITDSNRSLRKERDEMKTEMDDLRVRVKKQEEELKPMQDNIRELSIKAEAMQTENISLRGECTRWRQRAQMLIEKSNRTSPEDWRKLQNERETLARQVTIERASNLKLSDEVNTLRQDKTRLDEQLKSLRGQCNTQAEDLSRVKDELSSLQTQMAQVNQTLEQSQSTNIRLMEENRVITEDTASKDVNITELRNNLAQVRKIAKKYKTECENQLKELESLRQKERDTAAVDRQVEEVRTELQGRITQLEQTSTESTERSSQQISSLTEETETYKKEIESLKQGATEREERYKHLFKNAKERIVTLTEQVSTLKGQLDKQEGATSAAAAASDHDDSDKIDHAELVSRLDDMEKERATILAENERQASDIETLMQRVTQLQRQLGQQGAKPSPSSGSSEKPATEPPTANIKPMAGHSTNTQTQSVPIHPWRSAGETPLASIRPMSMSAQLPTVAVLPTSQSPSTVMIPPQQQVHTTGSSTIEVLSSSPTSSHTDYVPATSSASSAMMGPRQVVVPPTQSSQDTEDDDNVQMQATPQQQAVALVVPRIEPPSSGGGATQEQGTSSSSSSSNAQQVTTTQQASGVKRPREADTDQGDDQQTKTQQQSKRTRVQQAGTVSSDGGLEVEYQVPTSSQRDHDDDNVIVVESDEEGAADEGEGADDDPDDADTEGYDMEVEPDNYEEADCADVEDEEEGGNEVEVIDDSSEVPNQSERSAQEGSSQEEKEEQAQPEATSSGTDGTGRSVPGTPLQTSPQEPMPGSDDQGSSSQAAQCDAEIPQITVSGADDDDPPAEGSSEECMAPPSVAGTSTEGAEEGGQSEELEGYDAVTSEGEKPPSTEEGGEEEGREAEASPSTNTRSRTTRGPTSSSRRSGRSLQGRMMGRPGPGPTPIVWADQRHSPHRHPDGSRGRGMQQGYSSRAQRRNRGRSPRPFGRF